MMEADFFQWCLVKSTEGTDNKLHKKELFFTFLKIPKLPSMLVCKMPLVLVTWQESTARCWPFPDRCRGRTRTAGA